MQELAEKWAGDAGTSMIPMNGRVESRALLNSIYRFADDTTVVGRLSK